MIPRLLDPVFIGLVALLVGLAAVTLSTPGRRWRAPLLLAWLGFAWLWLAASPWFSNPLIRMMQPPPTDVAAAVAATPPERRAMVILAQTYKAEQPFVPPMERLDGTTRARLLGGARIFREAEGFGLVIVTGPGETFVEAMADYLELLGLPRERIALEPDAVNTRTNAIESAAIIRQHGMDQVVLVTSALHIPRAVAAFSAADLAVVPAPVDYLDDRSWRLLPSSRQLYRSFKLSHEVFGRVAARL
ncbi:MAG: YdcF family protein [Ectothiorhodospiraceae bacterium]|nr:YdcF family protein [Ectothiorhodospiraceae bacterium]